MLDELNRKANANELAALLFEGGGNVQRIETLAGLLGIELGPNDPNNAEAGDEDAAPEGDSVGIWKKENKNGEVSDVRDVNRKEDWTYWSQTAVIPPKQARKRVALLGESVARGYLYDPYYCPSQVLQHILDGSPFMEAEIIDLARTNLDLTSLVALTRETLALEPDALVIFAGNNWFYSIKRGLRGEDLISMEKILKESGLPALRDFLLQRFRSAIVAYLQQLADISRSRNIPVFFIIPEFNLMDWRSSQNEKILTALPNEQLRKWVSLRGESRAALAAGESEVALALAEQMIAVDCSHPEGYEIAAAVSLQKGDNAAARTHLEAARDTALFTRAYSKPRAYAIIRETLLKEAASYGVNLIDLPAVFSEHGQGALPGRELFLDYCHLSEEGIQVAMAATAQELIKTFAGIAVTRQQLDASRYTAGPEVHATAYICAAVHSAHYGQTHDVLDYLCEKAAGSSPVAWEIMSSFVDFATRKTTTTLCKSHEQLVEKEFITQYGGGVGFLHKRGQKIMDLALVGSMVRALKPIGHDLSSDVHRLRLKEHAVGNGTVHLTQSYYHSTAYDIYSGATPGYYQSRDMQSTFFLVAGSAAEVDFKLSFRTPFRDDPSDKVRITFNGELLQEYGSSEKWSTYQFTLPANRLREGLNVIDITWSTAFEFKTNNRVLPLTEDYILDKLYHVYGEITSFTAIAKPEGAKISSNQPL